MNLKKYFAKIGKKGGAAGKGAAKSRGSEQARAAARARWKKKGEIKMFESIEHITLNSDHVRDSPRSEVADDVLDAVRLLTCKSGAFDVPGQSGWRTHLALEQGAAVFDVRHSGAPIVVAGLAWRADASRQVWGLLDQMVTRFQISNRATCPATLPWLAVLLLPTAARTDFCGQEGMDWLGDYERCLAWAILEEHSGSITG